MKQTNEMKQAAFEKLMQENGFERTGATAYDGTELFGRTFKQQYELAFYGKSESTLRIEARISYGYPIIYIYENGRHTSTRDYSSPKRAMNALKEIIRCAGYAM